MCADGTELAIEVRYSEVLRETLVHAGEDGVYLLLAVIVEHGDVILLGGLVIRVVAEPVWVVAVDRTHQVVGVLVLRQLHPGKSRVSTTRAIGIDEQVTEFVVSSRSTHDIHEVLFELIHCLIAGSISRVAPLA